MSSRIDKPGAVKFRPGPPGKGRPLGGVPISQPTRPQQSRQAPPSSPSLPPQHQDQQQQRRPSLPPSPSLAPTSPSVRAQGHPSVPIVSPSRRPPALGAPIATPSNRREDALSRSSGGVPIRLPSTIPGAPGASPRMRTAPSPSPVPSLPGSSMGGSGSATKTKSYAFVSPAAKKVGGGSGGGVPITIGMPGPGRDASMGPPLRAPTPRAPSVGPSVGRRSVTPSPRQPSDTPAPVVSSTPVQRREEAGTSKANGRGRPQPEASAEDGSSAAPPQQETSKEAPNGLEAPGETSSKSAVTRRSKRTSGKERELPTKQANGDGNKEQAVSEPEAESDLEDSNAEDEYRPPVKAKRSRRGKNKEVEDVEGATSEPDVASSASQAKVAKRSHNPSKASTPGLAQEPTSTKTGKRKKTSERKTGEPKRPMNAFLLFKRDFSANDREKAHGLTGLTAHQDQMKRASHAWNATEAADKAKYKVVAEELKRKYDEEVKAFRASQAPDESSASETEGGETSEGGSKSGKKRRSAKRRSKTTTISEDEAEYLADLQKFGPELRGNRIDVNSTTMEDISSASFKRGRIGTRTFHMEKILKQKREERRRELRNEKDRAKAGGNNVKGEEVGHKEEQQAGSSSSKGMAALTSRGYIEGEEEEVIEPSDTEAARPNTGSERGQDDDDDFDEEEVEEEEGEGGASDAESVGAMSNATASTHHTLRENRFAVQTRIVDGKIVIDDASLQVSLGQDPSMDGVGAEYIDENEREKFVNSASWSKRRGRERWTAEETSQFFKAVSMWGTDFEMISRMFKSRDRASIKKKWRFEEGKNPRMLDAAFARRLPVDLDEYGVLTGVDLSGEAPRIEARNFDPDASMAEDQKRNRSKKEEGDHAEDEEAADEEEIVEEEGGASPTRVIRKKSTTPTRSPGLLRGESQEASLAIEEDDQEDLPALDASASKQKRRSSNASAISVPTRQRSQSISMSTSTTAVSGGAGGREKERQEKQQREKLRREKEMARRRPVAADDEDVEIVEE